MSLQDKLRQHAVSKKKTTKPSYPEITPSNLTVCWKCGTPENTGDNCKSCSVSLNVADAAYLCLKSFKDAEALSKLLNSALAAEIRPQYEASAKEDSFSKTFLVQGRETPGVKITWKDAFTQIEDSQTSTLQEKLGDKFDTFFKVERILTLKKTDDDTIAFLQEKLGEEKFFELFEIKLPLKCREDMDRKQFKLPAAIRKLLVQYQPAITLRAEE